MLKIKYFVTLKRDLVSTGKTAYKNDLLVSFDHSPVHHLNIAPKWIVIFLDS